MAKGRKCRFKSESLQTQPLLGLSLEHFLEERRLKRILSLLNPQSIPWQQAWTEAWKLFVFSAFFAVLFNAFYPYGISLKVEAPKSHHLQDLLKTLKPSSYSGWKTGAASKAPVIDTEKLELNDMPRVDLTGAKNRFDHQSAVFLDARSPDEYKEGHIPGALEFYSEDMDKYAPLVMPQLKDKGQEIITYCHGSSCDLSVRLAKTLIQQGYTNVKVFFGGWPEWKKASYPIQKGDQP